MSDLPLFSLLIWAYATALSIFDVSYPRRSAQPYFVTAHQVVIIIFSSIWNQRTICALITTFGAFISFIGALNTRNFAKEAENGRLESLHTGASILGRLTFDWVKPLLTVGAKHTLEDIDMWELPLGNQTNDAQKAYLRHKQYSVLRGIVNTYRKDSVVLVILSLMWGCAVYMSPISLSILLGYLEKTDSYSYFELWVCVIGMTAGPIISSFVFQQAMFLSGQLAMRARAIISQEIVQKCLTHAQAVGDFFIYIPFCLGEGLQIINAFALLGLLLGCRATRTVIDEMMVATDRRISIISEVLQSIRIIKFFAWEPQMTERIEQARENELSILWRRLILFICTIVNIIGGPVIVFCASLGAYSVVFGHILTPQVVFTSIALFEILKEASIAIPSVIFRFAQCHVSRIRIAEFLSQPDAMSLHISDYSDTPESTERIGFANCTFSWTAIEESLNFNHDYSQAPSHNFALSNLHFDFVIGHLNLVVGPTGCGKTSLLIGLLGEMPCVKGKAFLPRKRNSFAKKGRPSRSDIAYVAQQSWLRNVSIRDNILFGQPYNAERYSEVIRACALERDLEILDAGDRTHIGEKGITLSGGQKQRVSLARAIYSPARHILLDDCLSAVDSHTAQFIVKECILGPIMRSRTCILITHHVNLCAEHAAFAVLMEHGGIKAVASSVNEEIGSKPAPNSSVAYLHKETPANDEQSNPAVSRNNFLVEEEERNRNGLDLQVYMTYFKAGGSNQWWALVIGTFLIYQCTSVASNYWLSIWTSKHVTVDQNIYYFLVFVGLTLLVVITISIPTFLLSRTSIHASRNLHQRLVKRITNSTLRFFDKTPAGPTDSMNLTCQLVVVAATLPVFIPVAFIVVFWYFKVSSFFMKSSRSLKQLEAVSNGITTIRAYGMELWVLKESASCIDAMNRPTYLLSATSQWIFGRISLIAALITFISTLLIILSKESINASTAGFTLSYAISFSIAAGFFINNCTKVELAMNSIERIKEYLSIEQESPAIIEDARPNAKWPEYGAINIENLTIRYASDQSPAIRNLSLTVRPKERIGIVGRTGKCWQINFSAAFFRFVEAETGSIYIDGVDISKIGLRDLRSKLTIIPQDAVLFTGTIRSNLDPLSRYSDTAIWNALCRCHYIDSQSNKGNPIGLDYLDFPVAENGNNFSQGQRQLLAIARALLRNSKVIIMDEATASIDFDTDAKIQQTIRKEFADTTLICVAHRLRTIIDYDRIIVLDTGRLIEFDTPKNLINSPTSLFRNLCERSGELESLLTIVNGQL
ncbi:P-loop containing nucleoside triphosphate hydrolase protein [Syncephalis fuscata]|nr:P-loop containing nucleoside triphosphate hydrolase protein [Syncephalis fuscata]